MTTFVNPEAIPDGRPELERMHTFASAYCDAEYCGRPIDGNYGGKLCWLHRRGLRLSTALTDALTEFLGSAGQVEIPYDKEIEEAGEYISQGIELLLSKIFRAEVTMNARPILLGYSDEPDNNRHCWRVNLWWELAQAMPFGMTTNDDEGDDDDTLDAAG